MLSSIFINPMTKTVTSLYLPLSNSNDKESVEHRLDTLQSLVGGKIERVPIENLCDANWTRRNDLYVNEEFLFQGWTQGFFLKSVWPDPMLGPAVIVGHDGSGGATNTDLTSEFIANLLKWIAINND